MEKKEEKNKDYVELIHARTREQIEVMTQIKKDGVCPFCTEHLLKYHPKPILKETAWWFLTENMSPYEGTRVHLIQIYKLHVTFPGEVKKEAWPDFFKLIDWTIKKYNVEGGSILMRFGNMKMTGGSVDHFHAHLIVGNTDIHDPDKESLKVKLGYRNLNKL